MKGWYIYGFSKIAAGAKVIIYGKVTLPATTPAAGLFAYTFYNRHTSDILQYGFKIDEIKSGDEKKITIDAKRYLTYLFIFYGIHFFNF